jgi:hypothetical protein
LREVRPKATRARGKAEPARRRSARAAGHGRRRPARRSASAGRYGQLAQAAFARWSAQERAFQRLLEQAMLLARQLEQTAQAAPDGQVLARVEALAVSAAREFARQAVHAALQAQAEAVEKNRRPGPHL